MDTKGNHTAAVDMLIMQSLDEYTEMLEMLESLQNKMDKHSLAYIEKFNTAFYALQQQSQGTDKKIFEQLESGGISENVRKQLAHRESIQRDIQAALKKTVPMANTAKTLMASEIQTVKAGRKALSGYRNQANNQGKIVNRAS